MTVVSMSGSVTNIAPVGLNRPLLRERRQSSETIVNKTLRSDVTLHKRHSSGKWIIVFICFATQRRPRVTDACFNKCYEIKPMQTVSFCTAMQMI